mgnify:CR=1 FL=1
MTHQLYTVSDTELSVCVDPLSSEAGSYCLSGEDLTARIGPIVGLGFQESICVSSFFRSSFFRNYRLVAVPVTPSERRVRGIVASSVANRVVSPVANRVVNPVASPVASPAFRMGAAQATAVPRLLLAAIAMTLALITEIAVQMCAPLVQSWLRAGDQGKEERAVSKAVSKVVKGELNPSAVLARGLVVTPLLTGTAIVTRFA